MTETMNTDNLEVTEIEVQAEQTEETTKQKKKRKVWLVLLLIFLALLAITPFALFCKASPLAHYVQEFFAPEAHAYVLPSEEDIPERFHVHEVEVTLEVKFTAEGDKAEIAEEISHGHAKTTPVSAFLALKEFVLPKPTGLSDPAQFEAFAKMIEGLKVRVAELKEGIELNNTSVISQSILPALYEVSAVQVVVDELGNVWRLEELPQALTVTSNTTLTLQYALVNLEEATPEEIATYVLLAELSRFANAVDALNALLEEEEQTPAANGGTWTPRPGNNSGGGSGGNLASEHVHKWTRDLYTIEVEGHWETVVHPAKYNQWTECVTLCSSCQANITNKTTEHLKATGHSGCYTDYIYHREKISDEWTEEVWIEEQGHWSHMCTVYGCNAYELWYE